MATRRQSFSGAVDLISANASNRALCPAAKLVRGPRVNFDHPCLVSSYQTAKRAPEPSSDLHAPRADNSLTSASPPRTANQAVIRDDIGDP